MRKIASDLVEPSEKGSIAAEILKAPLSTDEGVLRNFFRILFIIKKLRDPRKDSIVISGYHHVVGNHVACLYALNQKFISVDSISFRSHKSIRRQ